MRIVILGAGQVGGTLAQNLAKENNDIFLVDQNEQRLQELQFRLDIQTIHGHASYPRVLMDAGIEQADMLIAVTNSDEINMMACQIAYSLFHTPTKIARIRSKYYYQYPQLFQDEHIPIDVCISPEKLVTEHLENLIHYPGTSLVLEFAEGRALLIMIEPIKQNVMVGQTIAQIHQHLYGIDAQIIAIFRQHQMIEVTKTMIIEPEDQVLFVTSSEAIQQLLIILGHYAHPNRRIIIAGGGHIGNELAQTLEENYRLKIIEKDEKRAHELSSQLHKTTVLQGDVADRELLINENIEFTDVFCAVTNDDEANIMSCLQAKRLGAKHVMALIQDLRKTPPIRPIDQRKTREFSRRGCRKDHLQCSFIYLRWRIFFPTERSHSPPKKVIWPIRILPIFAK